MSAGRRLTFVLAGLTLLALALSFPGSLRDAYERGGLYLFSRSFLEDIPKRLAGPRGCCSRSSTRERTSEGSR